MGDRPTRRRNRSSKYSKAPRVENVSFKMFKADLGSPNDYSYVLSIFKIGGSKFVYIAHLIFIIDMAKASHIWINEYIVEFII